VETLRGDALAAQELKVELNVGGGVRSTSCPGPRFVWLRPAYLGGDRSALAATRV
jgi:hypothetical protein